MKTIGMIGGTGWISTIEYYRIINEEVNRRLGGLNAAQLVLYSINFAELHAFQQENDMLGIYFLLRNAALRLQQAGAEALLLCTNTLHMFVGDLQKEIPLPFIHIGTATGNAIKKQGLGTIGLLGTQTTMEQDFYKTKLAELNIKTITPEKKDREFIHNTIFQELLKAVFLPESREGFLTIIRSLHQQGAEGVVLGCTEIPLLIKQEDIELPLFNTLNIHAQAAVDWVLSAS